MAVHDYVIANGTGAAVRSDLNDALAAIVSNNSSSSAPATTYAYQWWADTTANVLKIRNSANNAWITLRELDGTLLMEDGTAAAPGLAFADDTNTGIFSGGADQVGLSTNGVERFNVGTGAVTINDPGNDVDFRVESNGNTHMLFVDGGNNGVGIGTSSPGGFSSGANTLVVSTESSNAGITINNGAADQIGSIFFAEGTGAAAVGRIRYEHANNAMAFSTINNEAMRLDSSGRLLVGRSASRSNWNDSSIEPKVFIEGAGDNDSTALCVVSNSGSTSGASRGALLTLARTKGTAVGSNTAVDENTAIGIIEFKGNDGTSFTTAAKILAAVDGTPGTDDMPGRLVFSTTADGAAVPTERVRIDSSGNVGIGVTANFSNGSGLHVQRSGVATVRIEDSSNSKAGEIYADSSGLVIDGRGSGAVTSFDIAGSEKMRLDNSGRLLIGTSTAREHLNDGSDSAQVFIQGTTQNTSTLAVIRSSDNDGPSHLVLGKARGTGTGSTTVVQSGDTVGHINFEAADGSHLIRAGQISCVVDGTPGANDMPGRLKFSTCPNGSNGLVRRMEISNQGRLDVFASNLTDAHFISSAGSAGTAIEFIKCMHSASSIGSGTTSFKVSTNGNVQNTNNSYGQISDVKLKENIVDANSQWNDIKGVQVRNFNFKEETGNPTHTQIGVVAQEVETVSPGLVYETPDKDDDGTDLGTVTKSVNYSVLYMKAVKALQEAMNRIETLEAKVAALEAG